MKLTLSLSLAVTFLTTAALAAPLSFDFKDPKGVNNAVFKLDAPLEAINGSASGITGKVQFDPANPAATKGKIVIASASLNVSNPLMKEHLHSAKWLDVARFSEIVFDAKELKNVKTSGDVTTADAIGSFTLHGLTKNITVPVKLTYLKDKLDKRIPNMKRDLLVIRSSFTIKRSDYGIMPGQTEEKVSDEIELTLSIAGAAPH